MDTLAISKDGAITVCFGRRGYSGRLVSGDRYSESGVEEDDLSRDTVKKRTVRHE